MKRYLILWCSGAIISGALCVFWHLHNSGTVSFDTSVLMILEPATYVLWPTSLMLMSLSGQHPSSTFAIEAISVVMNGFIYLGVGYILGKVFGRVA